MIATLSWYDIALRLALAMVAGLLVGLDRGEHGHPAGLRTTVLVCVAATIAMLQANLLLAHTPDTHVSIIRLDLMRLPLGVLSGIGFIGAGAILRHGERVRGITTAATLWLVTIIGLCFGGGQLGVGIAGTAIALVTLWLLKYVESGSVFGRRGKVLIRFKQSELPEKELLAYLRSRGFRMQSRRLTQDPQSSDLLECTGLYRGAFPDWSSGLVQDLARRPGVGCVDWKDID